MKLKIGITFGLFALIGISAFAQEEKPVEVVMLPKYAFFPPGFDSNDNSQVTIAGYLPNTCYRAMPPEVVVDRLKKQIIIRNTALFYPNCFCLEVLVPYNHVIDLNVLRAGGYSVVAQTPTEETAPLGKLLVAESNTLGPDDLQYAPVSEAFAEEVQPGQFDLILRGHYPSRCMDIKEVKVLKRVPNVFEVLPVLDPVDDRSCLEKGKPFEVRVSLGEGITAVSLIHIRALNGQALNKLLNL